MRLFQVSDECSAFLRPLDKKPLELAVQYLHPLNPADSITEKAHEPFIKIISLKVKNTVPVTPEQIHIRRLKQRVYFLVFEIQLLPPFNYNIQTAEPI